MSAFVLLTASPLSFFTLILRATTPSWQSKKAVVWSSNGTATTGVWSGRPVWVATHRRRASGGGRALQGVGGGDFIIVTCFIISNNYISFRLLVIF